MTSRRNFNTGYANAGVPPTGIFRAEVVEATASSLKVRVPRLGANGIYSNVPYYGIKPAVGETIIVGLLEGNSGNPVAITPSPYGETAGGGGSSVGGANTQVQYNNSGVLAGSANFTFNGSSVALGASLQVGVDDTGYDVTFHGDAAGHKAHWDTSANALAISGSASMLRLVDLDSDSAPYIGFYDSSYNASEVTGRLGYVGYPNNDDLYVRNDNAGGITVVKSATTINLEATSGVQVGSDGSGHDVTFYSGTAGDNLTWDASEECLIITGTAGQLALDVAAGTVEFNGNFNVGTDGSGHDVRFYSATVGDSFHWDASDEILKITGTAGQNALSVLDGNVYIADTLDVDGTTNLDAVDIDGNVQIDGTLTVGVDNTGYDVIFYGATTANAFFWWDQSEDALQIAGHTTLGNNTTNYLNFKTGTTGTAGLIRWTFNTTDSIYASMGITYDDRATHGFYLDSAYPITLDATTQVNVEVSGNALAFFKPGGGSGYGGLTVNDASETISDNGIRLGQWKDSTYSGLFTGGHTTDEYMIISNGGSTFVSAGASSNVYIRAGNNDSANEITVGTGGVLEFDFSSYVKWDVPLPVVTGYSTLRRKNATSGTNALAVGYDGSSIRYKENVTSFVKSDWENIYNLQAVRFTWKEEVAEDKHASWGLISEDVYAEIPELGVMRVVEGVNDGNPVPDTVNYEQLCVFLIEAVKDLNTRLAAVE